MKLTRNFTLQELVVSSKFPNLVKDVHVPDNVKWNLFKLCRIILQNIRDQVDKPLNITSGYRPPALNLAVGGRSSSQHCFGEAVDYNIITNGILDQEAMIKAVAFTKAHLSFAIGEHIVYRNPQGLITHIHLSLPDHRFYSKFTEQEEKHLG